MSLKKITADQVKSNSIERLSNRPTAATRKGVGGLSADALKSQYDNLPKIAIDKINEMIDAIVSNDPDVSITAMINTPISNSNNDEESLTLYDVLADIIDGDLAKYLAITGCVEKNLEDELRHIEKKAISAYAIAVKNGFQGTEREWLASLNGKKGDPGARILDTVLIGQDEEGGNIYEQRFEDGSTARFVAPRGSDGKDGGVGGGEGEESVMLAGASLANGENSVAMGNAAKARSKGAISLGSNSSAGVFGYYIKAIDLANKKIYLSNTKVSSPEIVSLIPSVSVTERAEVENAAFSTHRMAINEDIKEAIYKGGKITLTMGGEVFESSADDNMTLFNLQGDKVGLDISISAFMPFSIRYLYDLVINCPKYRDTAVSCTVTVEDSNNHLDPEFPIPPYRDNIFSIINGYHYPFCGTIISIRNNEISYEGDLGFEEFADTESAHEHGYLFFVPDSPQHGSVDIGMNAVSIGSGNRASAKGAFAGGSNNLVGGNYGAVFGRDNKAGYAGLVTGAANEQTGVAGSCSGVENKNYGYISHSRGRYNNIPRGTRYAMVDGVSNKVGGEYNSAEGSENTIEGGKYNSIAGRNNQIYAGQTNSVRGALNKVHDGNYNDVSGRSNEVTGSDNHVVGHDHTVVAPSVSAGRNHVEGYQNKVYSKNSHIQGIANEAQKLDDDGAEVSNVDLTGYHNIGNGSHQTVAGKYNSPKSSLARITGGGTSNTKRKNIEELDWSGNVWFAGDVSIGSSRKKLITLDDLEDYIRENGSSNTSPELTQLRAQVLANASSIEANASNIQDAESEIGRVADDVNGLRASISSNSAGIASNATSIQELSDRVDRINISGSPELGSLTERVNTNASAIEENKRQIAMIANDFDYTMIRVEGDGEYDSLTRLTERANTHESDIKTNENRLASLANAFSDSIASIEGGEGYDSLVKLTERANTHESDIKTNENRLASLANAFGDSITAIEGDGDYLDLTTITQRINDLEGAGKLENRITANEAKIGDNAEDIEENKNRISQIEGGGTHDNLTNLTARVSANEQDISQNFERFKTLINTHGNDIEELEKRDTALEDRITANEQEISQNFERFKILIGTHADDIQTLEARDAELDGRISANEQEISQNFERFKTLINTHGEDITRLETIIEDLVQQIEGLMQQVEYLEQRISDMEDA